MQRKLTRHLLICINSFNSSRYVRYALELINQINLELGYGGVKFSILCVFGGCSTYTVCSFDKTTYVSIPQNLSDHNVYMGISYCHSLSMLPSRATCVMLHDTSMVKQGCFRKMMMKLSRLDLSGWVFGIPNAFRTLTPHKSHLWSTPPKCFRTITMEKRKQAHSGLRSRRAQRCCA